jgi:hypothetical protein
MNSAKKIAKNITSSLEIENLNKLKTEYEKINEG